MFSQGTFFQTFSLLFQFAVKVKCRQISLGLFSCGPHLSLERGNPAKTKAREIFLFASKVWNIGYCLFVGCVYCVNGGQKSVFYGTKFRCIRVMPFYFLFKEKYIFLSFRSMFIALVSSCVKCVQGNCQF